MANNGLTPSQLGVLRVIHNFKIEHDWEPTVAEITEQLGDRTAAAVGQVLKRLHVSKFINRKPHRLRGVSLTERGIEAIRRYEDIPALATSPRRMTPMPMALAVSEGA